MFLLSGTSPVAAFHGKKWGHSGLRSEGNQHFGTWEHCLEEGKHRNAWEGRAAAGEGWAWKGEKTTGTNVTALEWDEAEQKNVLLNFLIQTLLDSKINKEEAGFSGVTWVSMSFSVCFKSHCVSQLCHFFLWWCQIPALETLLPSKLLLKLKKPSGLLIYISFVKDCK